MVNMLRGLENTRLFRLVLVCQVLLRFFIYGVFMFFLTQENVGYVDFQRMVFLWLSGRSLR